MAALRALNSLISRSRLSQLLGITFKGQRDLYQELGYKRNLIFSDYHARYMRGGIAGRLVEIFPQATWRNSPTLRGGEAFNKEWESLQKRLNIYFTLERLDRISGIGDFGILFIGTGENSETPLTGIDNADDIHFLTPFHAGSVTISKFVEDITNPRFSLPEMYSINQKTISTVGTISQTSKSIPFKAHWSRIIHVAEGVDENINFGKPRLERSWNFLDDLDKIQGGSSEAVWQTIDRGVQWNIDPDASLSEPDKKETEKQIQEYILGFRKSILTQGITATVLGSETIDPTGSINATVSLISGTTGIPQRILLGSERGQLASSQDGKNFDARVTQRQISYAEPSILRPLVNMLIAIGALPTPENNEYEVVWPDPSTQTDREKADVAARLSQAIDKIAAQGSSNRPNVVMTSDEFRGKFLNLPPLSDDQISTIKVEPAPDTDGATVDSSEN